MKGPLDDSLLTRWSKIDRMEQKDSEEEWRWFLDRYRSFVVGLLSKNLRSRHRAEQAAEEFWAYFLQHRIHARAERSMRFRAFLTVVVRNYGMDWARKNHVPQSPDLDSEVPQPAVFDTVAEDEEMRIFARTLIHNALHRLATGTDHEGNPSFRPASPESCRILSLFYGIPARPEDPLAEPMKASQIVAALGVPMEPNAVHKRLHDTRARLREILVDEVRETVPTRSDLHDELNLLLGAIQQVARGLVV